MTSLHRCTFTSSVFGLCFAAVGAYAQVSTINSAVINSRVSNDVPGATLNVDTIYHPYPSPTLISFTEQGVSAPSPAFANRDAWHFSANGGVSPYLFQKNDYFSVSMNVTLMGSPNTPRKEAGFVFNNPLNDGGEFILDTDAHEIVAFGGFLPFYAFPATFNSGDTVTMGITYASVGGVNSIMYSANGLNSPFLPLTNLELGLINNTTIGGYFQIQNDPTDPNNSGIAVFQNIKISSVPEPSSLVLLSAGLLPLLLRRRRS